MRRLTPRTSLGFAVIEFAETVLLLTLFPWQKWLLIHMLELRPDNLLRFRTVIVLAARQNGKSTISQVLALWFMYVYGVALVIGTAQDLDVAEEIWQGAVDLIEEIDEDDEPVRPELLALLDRVIQVNGKKALVLKTGERYKVKAANRRSGRSLSGDLILLDELREHQSWDAWAALTKTTMARPMALILALSNAGDATSIVLRYLRKMAHAALGDPDGINAVDDPASLLPSDDDLDDVEIAEDDDSLGIFEWSARPGCDVRDWEGRAQANPSAGYTIAERTIDSACRTDPEWVFRTEVLCQWSDGSLEGPFPPGAWEAGVDKDSAIVGNVKVGIDVSFDRSRAHIAFAGRTADGTPHVEVVATRAGVEWVLPWLQDPKRVDLIEAIAGQGKGAPVSGLLQELKDAGLPVAEWQGSDLTNGSGAFYDLVRNNGVRHLPQPVLDVAAATAVTKPSGDGWLWNRRGSPTDIAPLIAANAAVWLLSRPDEAATASVYETRGMVSL